MAIHIFKCSISDCSILQHEAILQEAQQAVFDAWLQAEHIIMEKDLLLQYQEAEEEEEEELPLDIPM